MQARLTDLLALGVSCKIHVPPAPGRHAAAAALPLWSP